MTINGSEMEKWTEALLSAFLYNELNQMLRFRLNENLQNISLASDYKTVVFDVVDWFNRRGEEISLLQAARESNPKNPRLQVLGQQYGLALEAPSGFQLEKIIKKSSSFLDVALWREKLGELEARVCRVEIKGEAEGTGFLVGPSAVLTNYHVIESVHKNEAKPGDVGLHFDYKVLSSGKKLDGTILHLVDDPDDWLIAWSPYSSIDGQAEPKKGTPGENELDYALLLVDGTPGKSKLGEKPNPEAPPRGWVDIPDKGHKFSPNSALHIIQHPQGQPLKLSLNTDAVLSVNGNGTRVTYTTNTEPGSSGSPCFDANWDLIALHHSGEPDRFPFFWRRPNYNEGIPIYKILASLDEKGVRSALKDA